MALFGFAISYNSGGTDYVLVSADSIAEAEAVVAVDGPPIHEIEGIVRYDSETIVQEQYGSMAVLSNVFNGGC